MKNLTKEEQIEILKSKIAKAHEFLERVRKEYEKSLAKIEKQKQAAKAAKRHIQSVEAKAGRRLAALQSYLRQQEQQAIWGVNGKAE